MLKLICGRYKRNFIVRCLYSVIMKVIISIFVLIALSEAKKLNWEPINVYEPVKGFNWRVNDERIANGQEAPPHAFPYQAAVISNIGSCGGSLISDKVILTAAHCVNGAEDILVILGAHDKSQSEPEQVRQWTTKYVKHAEWNKPVRYANDIALVFLEEPVEFTAEISPISLPKRSEMDKDFERFPARVSGWGKVGQNSYTDKLQYTDTQIIGNKQCDDTFHGLILDSTLCTLQGNKTTCQGDSGGPLVTYDDSRFIQVGVVSFGSVACGSVAPQAFARVTKFLDWIEENSDIKIQ